MVEKRFLLEVPWWLGNAMRTANVMGWMVSDWFVTFSCLIFLERFIPWCVGVALLTSVVGYGYVAVFL